MTIPSPSRVGCVLGFDVTEPAVIVLQVAAARPSREQLSVVSDGHSIETLELPDSGGRKHLFTAPAGTLTMVYSADVATHLGEPAEVIEVDRIVALRRAGTARPTGWSASPPVSSAPPVTRRPG